MEIFLFNWNGTLIDDIKIWHSAIVRVFHHFGAEPPTIDEWFSEYRGDYFDIYRQKGITVPQEEVTAVYTNYYKETLPEISLFTGAEKTIAKLWEAGRTLGIVSSQPEDLVRPVLERLGLFSCFSHLCFYPLNKVQAILKILDNSREVAAHCCYVSHTLADIIAANQAGIVSIAFLNGYLPEALVDSVNPKHKIKNLKDLINL